jgi:hypothetical protein
LIDLTNIGAIQLLVAPILIKSRNATYPVPAFIE